MMHNDMNQLSDHYHLVFNVICSRIKLVAIKKNTFSKMKFIVFKCAFVDKLLKLT